MNLIIDLGNTRLKAAVFNGKEIVAHRSFSHDTLIENLNELSKGVNCVVISSVINSIPSLEDWLNNSDLKVYSVSDLLDKYPIKSQYLTPETLGEDRICNVIAACDMFPDRASLCIDLGTCNKYDLVSGEGEYQGGAISPGYQMRLNAMHHFTDRLPLLDSKEVSKIIGDSSENSMFSGAYYGIIGEINFFIEQYKAKFPDLNVILSGGFAIYFEKALKNHIFADPNLTLRGMNELLNSLVEK